MSSAEKRQLVWVCLIIAAEHIPRYHGCCRYNDRTHLQTVL